MERSGTTAFQTDDEGSLYSIAHHVPCGTTRGSLNFYFFISIRGDKLCLGVPFASNNSSILAIVISDMHLAAFLLLLCEATASALTLHFLSRSTIHARCAAKSFE